MINETPITVAVGVDGTPFDFNSVAMQLAGALSHAMLPRDAEVPSEQINEIVDRFVYLHEDEDVRRDGPVHATRSIHK